MNGYQYDLTGNARDCVTRYCDLAKVKPESLKAVATPCIDDSQIAPEDFEDPGILTRSAAKIVLKCLWIARLTRLDIMWTVNYLARNVTKWTKACDKRLLRLISYINCTSDLVLYAYIGDPIEDC